MLLSLLALGCGYPLLGQEIIGSRSIGLERNASSLVDLQAADLQSLVLTWTTSAAPKSARYRFTDQRGRLGAWQAWSLDNEAGKPASRLLTLSSTARRIEIDVEGHAAVRLKTTAYAKTPTLRPAGMQPVANTGTCDCPSPAVVTRAGWCPNGDCAPANAPTAVAPRHLILHHSGTTVSSSDYALVVRAIRDFHVNTNGWDDIGYNYLVAPDGTVYAGRGSAAQGAHFCGANSETLGVCLLGNFNNSDVPAAALASVTNLASFLGCDLSIDPFTERLHAPSGEVLPGLAGHRDGCNTECPGTQLYSLLPILQAAVAGRMERGCQSLPAPANLMASSLSDGAIELDWELYAGATTIFIERSTPTPNAFELVAEVAGTLASYVDLTPPSGANYYRIRALVDGSLTDYSNEVLLSVSSSEASPLQARPRLARNPVRGLIEIKGLTAPVDQAFVTDPSGRNVLELHGSTPSWQIGASSLRSGNYWVTLFSGNEWYTVQFEYHP